MCRVTVHRAAWNGTVESGYRRGTRGVVPGESLAASVPSTGAHQGGRRTTASYRIGIGFDSHRLVDGGPLRIGGCDVPFNRRLDGHSDADVLLHAITDALLGAAARGDIGEMFPNTDPANRGRDSREMLQLAYEQVRTAGFRLVNLDCVVHAQRPKLSPHKNDIRHEIAAILSISLDQIGLKGKTGEGVGTVGREEVIAAQCVVLLEFDETEKP